LPTALVFLVVGVIAGGALGAFGLVFRDGGGTTITPAHADETRPGTPLPGLAGGPSPLPEQSASNASPSPSDGQSQDAALPQVARLSTASAQCLDVEHRDAGAEALAAECTESDQQRWQLNRGTSDQYVIASVSTGKCLAVENASRDDGARILQSDCRDAAEQRWLARLDGNTFALANVNSGMCAAVEGDGRLRQHPCGEDPGQRWDVRE
jgi:hypothetical protein